MKSHVNKGRRQTLRLLACLSAMGTSFFRCAIAHGKSFDDLASRLVRVIGNRESARVVGEEYLKSWPAEAGIDRLVRLILWPKPVTSREDVQMSLADISALVRHRQNEDFSLERVVNVQGWILSRTEARLCALCALL